MGSMEASGVEILCDITVKTHFLSTNTGSASVKKFQNLKPFNEITVVPVDSLIQIGQLEAA
jgi:hypothetical protein